MKFCVLCIQWQGTFSSLFSFHTLKATLRNQTVQLNCESSWKWMLQETALILNLFQTKQTIHRKNACGTRNYSGLSHFWTIFMCRPIAMQSRLTLKLDVLQFLLVNFSFDARHHDQFHAIGAAPAKPTCYKSLHSKIKEVQLTNQFILKATYERSLKIYDSVVLAFFKWDFSIRLHPPNKTRRSSQWNTLSSRCHRPRRSSSVLHKAPSREN